MHVASIFRGPRSRRCGRPGPAAPRDGRPGARPSTPSSSTRRPACSRPGRTGLLFFIYSWRVFLLFLFFGASGPQVGLLSVLVLFVFRFLRVVWPAEIAPKPERIRAVFASSSSVRPAGPTAFNFVFGPAGISHAGIPRKTRKNQSSDL